MHAQNFFIVCGTALPVLFVAISVQRAPRGERPGGLAGTLVGFGLAYCFLGELTAAGALAFDDADATLQVVVGIALFVGMLSWWPTCCFLHHHPPITGRH